MGKSIKPIEMEKVVIILQFEPKENLSIRTRSSYEFAERIIDKILIKHDVITDRIFIGGSKRDLQLYISSLIDVFYMKDMDTFVDESMQFDFDPDFDVANENEKNNDLK